MKRLFDIKLFRLYLWMGLGLWLLALLHSLTQQTDTFWEAALVDTWWMIYITVVHYIFFEFTRPRLSWKRADSSVLRIFLHLFLYSCGLYIWMCIGMGVHLFSRAVAFDNSKKPMSELFAGSVFSLIVFGIIRHIYYHIKLKQAAQQLRIEKQQAELNYLKSQTNPHFLFNTLNNIYSLSRDKSDLAPESIMRLSKILRYMLYDAGGDFIAIEQDLKIISDYIELEKLRYDDSLRINFNYDVEDMKQALPPLLLIPLVENAFKHGVSETRNQPFVDIHLSVNKRQLVFLVSNSTEEPPVAGVKENIGLSNLRRQLELLYTDYSLVVEHRESMFTATLKINLASHV